MEFEKLVDAQRDATAALLAVNDEVRKLGERDKARTRELTAFCEKYDGERQRLTADVLDCEVRLKSAQQVHERDRARIADLELELNDFRNGFGRTEWWAIGLVVGFILGIFLAACVR